MKKIIQKTKNCNRYKFIFGIFFIFIFNTIFVNTVNASTAQIYLRPSATTFANQSEFSVDVFVDSSNVINALDLQISYSPKSFEYLGYSYSHSVVSFWQNSNVLLSKGHIRLAGGMIPTFSGTDGYVATIRFKAISSGASKISFEQNNLYLSDGKGTKLFANSSPVEILVNDNASLLVASPVSTDVVSITMASDVTPPNLFARVVKDSISGNNLIVYKTDDPESGVRTVEMRANEWGNWTTWQEIKNPAVYPDGALKVEIRSINNNGGITVLTLTVEKWYQKIINIIPIILAAFVFFLVYNKKRRKPKI